MSFEAFAGFGVPTIAFDSVKSTMDEARRLLAEGYGPGTAISARRMSAGRGQRGASWFVAPDAAICLTAIGLPVAAGDAWKLSVLVAVAVIDAIHGTAPGAPVGVRYPNDLYADGKKVGGILIETVAGEPGQMVPLIGIGINVRAVEFPDDIRERAQSLETACGAPVEIAPLQLKLLAALTSRWRQWRADGFAPIVSSWNGNLVPSEPRRFLLDGEPVLCRVLSISANGILTLRLPDDSIRYESGLQTSLLPESIASGNP